MQFSEFQHTDTEIRFVETLPPNRSLVAVGNTAARHFLTRISLLGHDSLLDLDRQENRWVNPQGCEESSKHIGDNHVGVDTSFNRISVRARPDGVVRVVVVDPIQHLVNHLLFEDDGDDQVQDGPNNVEDDL